MFWGLFGAAFLAATVLPAQSEAVLVAVIVAGKPWGLAVLVASLGNTLGAATSFALGWFGAARFKPEALARARAWLGRWGYGALLLSWVPIVGDALVLAAGAARLRPLPALALVALGKVARYIVIAQAALPFAGGA